MVCILIDVPQKEDLLENVLLVLLTALAAALVEVVLLRVHLNVVVVLPLFVYL